MPNDVTQDVSKAGSVNRHISWIGMALHAVLASICDIPTFLVRLGGMGKCKGPGAERAGLFISSKKARMDRTKGRRRVIGNRLNRVQISQVMVGHGLLFQMWSKYIEEFWAGKWHKKKVLK